MKRTYYCYYAKRCFVLFLFLSMTLVAQAQTVAGTVTDESGVPLPGATVVVLTPNIAYATVIMLSIVVAVVVVVGATVVC